MQPWSLARAALAALSVCSLVCAQGKEPDRDGDGLSDFHEIHKYRTDPARADTDGDGIPDGDWRERREYQYTVRCVVQVMKPVTPEWLTDDYQDARVLDETAQHVELEVVLYPFNTVAKAIAPDATWRRTAKQQEFAPWLAPGPTSDWTPALRSQLVAALQQDGIEVDKLDDVALVQQASRWLLQRAAYHDGFSTFVTAFDAKGKPFVPEELRGGRSDEDLQRQWAREISARGIFEHRQRGSCSSTAIYLSGCLRALGIPTRTVLCIPLIDGNDEQEQRMLGRLQHHGVRAVLQRAAAKLRGSWSSHTFNEVFVGGRWRRLNNDRLGQGIHDPDLFGMIVHVATFRDWADADMPATIGRRQKLNLENDAFGFANPYSTISLRDEFGAHCTIENPAPDVATIRVKDVLWTDSPALPANVRDGCAKKERFGLIAVLEGVASSDALREFVAGSDCRVWLEAKDRPRLGVGFDPGCWWYDDGTAWIYVPFGAGDRRDLAQGVPYVFTPRNDNAGFTWQLPAPLQIARQDPVPK